MGSGVTGKLGCARAVYGSVHGCMGFGWMVGKFGLCDCMGCVRDQLN